MSQRVSSLHALSALPCSGSNSSVSSPLALARHHHHFLHQQQQQSASTSVVGPSLQASLPARHGSYELAIVSQPELNHRARYLTEGSRGSVKDRSHQGYPAVQLIGWSEPVHLCVFVATETGRVRPHTHYQACRVAGKGATSRAAECDREGTKVLTVAFNPREGSVLSLDCIGILKLRNVDVVSSGGQKRGAAGKRSQQQQHQQQGSARARLVFRVCLHHADGRCVTLQTVSEPIVCTQPIGSPEVLRVSSTEGPCHGNTDLFIIGKNFAKGCSVAFQELAEAGGVNSLAGREVIWEADAAIETDYFTQAHMICRVPPYRRSDLTAPITVQVTVRCEARVSDPFYYTYKPAARLPIGLPGTQFLHVTSTAAAPVCN